ncbi:hypothetical protein [Spiroplasma chinense]|nr:hypothetical protein [Spiroplasma chinense]
MQIQDEEGGVFLGAGLNIFIGVNLIYILLFSYYLYDDFKSGLWNQIKGSKITPIKIIWTYLLNGLILAFLNLTFYLVWTWSFNVKMVAQYGILNFLLDYYVRIILYCITLAIILFTLFKFLPEDRMAVSITLILLILVIICTAFLNMIFNPIFEIKSVEVIFNILPFFNIWLLETKNALFWIPYISNLLVLIGLMWLTLGVKRGLKLWHK